MRTFSVEILNPKALKLLMDLADMELITLNEKPLAFEGLLEELRSRGKKSGISEDDISKEVDFVRTSRYANKK